MSDKKPTRYRKSQVQELIKDGLISQKQVDEKVKAGEWEVVEREPAARKEKEFTGPEHESFYKAQAKVKEIIKPMFKKITENPDVAKFLSEWGSWEDATGTFELSVEYYIKGSKRAENTFTA